MTKVLIAHEQDEVRRAAYSMLSAEGIIATVALNISQTATSVRATRPDVVLLSVAPGYLEAIKEVLAERWVPIILLTDINQPPSSVFEGIKAGAVDFAGIDAELIPKITAAAGARSPQLGTASAPAKFRRHTGAAHKVVLIATSTGGPQTLERLLPEIPKDVPAPILIVQHMPPNFTRTMAERLDTICEIDVREAQEGDKLENGVALIAPGGRHMELRVRADGEAYVHLTDEPHELSVRPCANKLFRTAAPIFQENTIAIVLTGMGWDGKDGARVIKHVKGTVIAEAEESCVIFGMPREVINAGYADEVVSIQRMTVALLQLIEQ